MGLATSLVENELASNSWVLTALALLPAIILCVYVFKKDRVEKEPLGLLLGLLALGALSCFPAGIVEGIVGDLIDAVFAPFGQAVTENGQEYVVFSSLFYHLYQGTSAFIGVALIEELGKWLVLILLTRRSKHFNSLFDGVIYAVFASLGFAALENVMYAFQYGLGTVLMRAVTSIPGHMFFGVFMGVYYSIWKVSTCAYEGEKQLAAKGTIRISRPINPNGGKWMSLLIPVLVHGFYDYCLFVGSTVLVIIFYIFLIAMYFVCFNRIRHFSKADHGIENYAAALVLAKYQMQANGKSISDEDQVDAISTIIDNTANTN